MVLFASVYSVTAVFPPSIVSPSHNQQFSIFEDSNYLAFVNGIDLDGDYPLNFSDDALHASKNFTCFNMDAYNSTAALINFTPDNDCVKDLWSVIISVDDFTDGVTAIKVFFNITNNNDIPTILNTSPLSPFLVDENASADLWANVYDDDLIYGDNLTYVWLLDGVFSSKLVENSSNMTFTNATYTPSQSDFDAGNHTITLIVNDTSGQIAAYNWTATVLNINRQPIFNGTVPNITLIEDTNLTDYLSLMWYSYDPDANGTLVEVDTNNSISYSYIVIDGSDANILISINETTGNLSIYPDPDWFGNLTIQFEISDTDLLNYSNNVSISVINTNDPPSIPAIANITSYSFANITYTVIANDADNDILTYTINSSTLNITFNSVNGFMWTYPTIAEVGNHTVNVTVTDGTENSSRLFYIRVISNFMPQIHPIANQSVTQYGNLSIIVNGTDPDNDSFIFFTETPYLSYDAQINASHWNFTFSPIEQSWVGNHTVRIYINDSKGAQTWSDFNLQIIDMPAVPSIYPVTVTNGQLKNGTAFTTNVLAFDEDGDIEEFSDNASQFNVITSSTGNIYTNATGSISFTPTMTGNFSVNITVNDSTGRSNSTIFNYEVTLNRAPYLTNANNFTFPQNRPYSGTVEGSDPDWQDLTNLRFGSNSTFFTVNQFTGDFSFTYPNVSQHEILLWISDGEYNTTDIIFINITERNDPPYFVPNISLAPQWLNVTENKTTYFTLHVEDYENDSISVSINYINFTDLNGTTVTSGIDLFNFTVITTYPDNSIDVLVNFTPPAIKTGLYWVNVTSNDSISGTDYIFPINVQNVNNNPLVDWNLNYPNTSLVLTGNAVYTVVNVTENTTLSITTTVTDLDFDNLAYQWYYVIYNGTRINIDTTEDISFFIPFESYPNATLVFNASDDNGGQTLVQWRLLARNVNRDLVFGQYSFNISKGTCTNCTISNGTISLMMKNVSAYQPYAEYRSQVHNFKTTSIDRDRIRYDTLSYNDRANGSYVLDIYTGSTNIETTSLSTWNVYNGTVNSENYYFLGFRFDINSTPNQSQTPLIDEGIIHYAVHDLFVPPNTIYQGWINLDYFFSDPDSDDNRSYNVSIISGGALVNASIFQQNLVKIQFYAAGTAQIQFAAFDGFNSTAFSNIINITIDEDAEEQQQETESNSGGGGGSSGGGGVQIRKEYQYRPRDVPVALDLIHPQQVTMYQNDTIEIPIEIRNNDEFDLRDIAISTRVNQSGIQVVSTLDFIPSLKKGETTSFKLIANVTDVYDSYDVFVSVNVSEPEFYDTAKVMITTLKKLRESNESTQLKLSFARDLLQKNKECAELSEYIQRAQDYFAQGSTAKGNEMLEYFIQDCKFLIGEKDVQIEQPNQITLLDTIRGNQQYMVLVGTLIAITLLTIIIAIFIYRKI